MVPNGDEGVTFQQFFLMETLAKNLVMFTLRTNLRAKVVILAFFRVIPRIKEISAVVSLVNLLPASE